MGSQRSFAIAIAVLAAVLVVAGLTVRYYVYGDRSGKKTGLYANPHFKIYWNIPSQSCLEKFKVDLGLEQYPMVVNSNGNGWMGDNITIFYQDLGLYPQINVHTGERINGGIPQLTDWNGHWKKVKKDIVKRIPDENYSGLGVLDYEPWRPLFKRNFGSKRIYQNASMILINQKYPCINETKTVKKLAEFEFEEAAKEFMLGTLRHAQKLRPKAKWGYYHFIYCYKHLGENVCAKKELNDSKRSPEMCIQVDDMIISTPGFQNQPLGVQVISQYEFLFNKEFMLGTLLHAKRLRPKAKWGYYHFIYCYKRNSMENVCLEKDLNDRMSYLLEASDAYFPTAYLHKNMNVTSKWLYVNGQIREMKRMRRNIFADTPFRAPDPAYMYLRIRYQSDFSWLSEMDLKQSIGQVYKSGLDGVILWENHYISDTLDHCKSLQSYVAGTLGPYIVKMLRS